MVTLNLTEEQVVSLLKQLPPARRKQVLAALEEDESFREARITRLRRLLRQTQSLPQAKKITEEEISSEIALYRAGK